MINKDFVFTCLIILLGVAFLPKTVEADPFTRDQGWSFREAPAHSGFMSGLSPKKVVVQAVYASTPATNTSPYFIVIDSPAYTGVAPSGSGDVTPFDSAQWRSPPAYFSISSSVVSGPLLGTGLHKVIDYGGDGISFASAPYVIKSATSSGGANRVFLQLKQ